MAMHSFQNAEMHTNSTKLSVIKSHKVKINPSTNFRLQAAKPCVPQQTNNIQRQAQKVQKI